jgi:GTP cyclohydrolase I
MYAELFSPKPCKFTVFPESHDSMIVLRGHDVHGICPHHLLPVHMRVYLAYIPNGKVLGLSKLARLVESRLSQPVLQETFTDSIVNDLQSRLGPKGVSCIVVGRHGCMQHRGVRTTGDVVTSAISGVFVTNPSAKSEFLRIVGAI